MKSIITTFLLILSTIFCPSCKKDAVAVKGEWKWLYSSHAGFSGFIYPSNGKTVSLSLKNDSTYMFYLNNQTNAQGTYSITSSSGISTIDFDTTINIDNLTLWNQEGIYQSNDSLFLISNHIAESPTAVFVKVK